MRRRFASFRCWLFVFVFASMILAATLPPLSHAVDPVHPQPAAPANIVIGFVGGWVGHDRPNHGPIELAWRIQRSVPKATYVQVFENRHRKNAYITVLHLLDKDHSGVLSPEEKSHARIILFGHSWGAAAAVALAADLRRQGIPVLLTAQVDSIAKFWQNDSIIPDNVAEAINFYQPHGILRGRQQIKAADPAKTEILGNYREDYKKNPVQCSVEPWFNRLFTSGHMQSECDPHVWSKIESMVRQRLDSSYAPASTAAAAIAPAPDNQQR